MPLHLLVVIHWLIVLLYDVVFLLLSLYHSYSLSIIADLFVFQYSFSFVLLVFFAKLFELMDWNIDYRYKLLGKVIHANGEYLIAFDLNASEIYQRIAKDGGKPKTARTPVFPAGWKDQFGLPYREHQKSLQINIFDGYAIYGIKDSTVSSTASVENVTSAHNAYQPEVPVQEGSVNG